MLLMSMMLFYSMVWGSLFVVGLQHLYIMLTNI